jgi:hypothetical protein
MYPAAAGSEVSIGKEKAEKQALHYHFFRVKAIIPPITGMLQPSMRRAPPAIFRTAAGQCRPR